MWRSGTLHKQPARPPLSQPVVGTVRDTDAMAYDEDLVARVRDCVQQETGLSEQKMFGGLAFLINGRMAVAVSGQGGLLLRVDPAQTEALARRPHACRFVMRGREMNGWLRVDPLAVQAEADLERWVQLGVAYVRSLPPK
jgi:hypothetical protein